MRLNDKAIADDYNETVKVISATSNLLESVKAIVFDLRQTEKGSRLANPGEMSYEFMRGTYAYKGLNNMLCSAVQSLPARRFPVHDGLKPEASGGNNIV